MGKKKTLRDLFNSNKREHYKMHKSGKQWVFTMLTASSGILGSYIANAEETADGNVLATQENATISSSTTAEEGTDGNDTALPNFAAKYMSLAAFGDTSQINVATDPDSSRADFDNNISSGIVDPTPTSITVATPDQVVNKASYRQQAITNGTYAAVSDWNSLKTAYSDNTKTYIEVTGNITAAATSVSTRDLGWRQNSVIIDGNGHTVNMAGAAFNVGTSSTARGSIFTITDINLIHWQSGTLSGDSGTGAADAVIDSRNATGGYGYWNYNINNVTLSGRDGVSGTDDAYQPRRLLDAEDSQVTFSGTIIANAKQELTQIGQVDIANGAHVELNRTAGTTGYSMFYYMSIRGNNAADTGYAHTFRVGDGATILGNELSSYASNSYPLVYYTFSSMTVGDDVTWKQDGFQMLIDLYRGSANGRSATFGQNLNMVATRTVGTNALSAYSNGTITFNAGTTLDLEQWNDNTIVWIDGGSTIRFISPKKLHIARLSSSGAVTDGNIFNISGAGKFTMNNSLISTWSGTSSQTANPSGTSTAKFTNLVVGSSAANSSITDTAGNTTTSPSVIQFGGSGTRELSTNAIDPGTVKINYINQNGTTVKSIDVPIDKDTNYIGQYLPLVTAYYAEDNMPENYMWALASQVPTSAATDAQSGGDSTTTADNGDAFGQANTAIVPMEGTEYTYNIYVYGEPNTSVQYQYMDVKTGNIVASD